MLSTTYFQLNSLLLVPPRGSGGMQSNSQHPSKLSASLAVNMLRVDHTPPKHCKSPVYERPESIDSNRLDGNPPPHILSCSLSTVQLLLDVNLLTDSLC